MAIIVDDSKIPWRRGIYCHMMSDHPVREEEKKELIRFAVSIGMKKEWFQYNPRFMHFDLTKTMKAKAIKAGAREVTAREMVQMVRKREKTEEYLGDVTKL